MDEDGYQEEASYAVSNLFIAHLFAKENYWCEEGEEFEPGTES